MDAISSFLADEFDMEKLGVDLMLTGSQKALACPPGISVIVLSEHAVQRVYEKTTVPVFRFERSVKNGERGQTPFTPAVGIPRQIHARLLEIEKQAV